MPDIVFFRCKGSPQTPQNLLPSVISSPHLGQCFPAATAGPVLEVLLASGAFGAPYKTAPPSAPTPRSLAVRPFAGEAELYMAVAPCFSAVSAGLAETLCSSVESSRFPAAVKKPPKDGGTDAAGVTLSPQLEQNRLSSRIELPHFLHIIFIFPSFLLRVFCLMLMLDIPKPARLFLYRRVSYFSFPVSKS